MIAPPRQPRLPASSYHAIGLFSPHGTSCTMLMINGEVKQFGSYQQAESYIEKHRLPANASPVQIYEE